MNEIKWKNETRKLDDLIPSDYNPRKLTKKNERFLQDSLDSFGMADVIVINLNNHIIGGHQRYFLLKKKGVKTIDVRVPDRLLTDDEERELNLRLNKNLGEFEKELLKDFDKDLLENIGFTNSEIEKMFDEPTLQGDVEFTTEVLEENNYLLFVFNDVVDWNFIKENFDLKAVEALDSKEGYRRKGTGRVIDGKKLIDKIKP